MNGLHQRHVLDAIEFDLVDVFCQNSTIDLQPLVRQFILDALDLKPFPHCVRDWPNQNAQQEILEIGRSRSARGTYLGTAKK